VSVPSPLYQNGQSPNHFIAVSLALAQIWPGKLLEIQRAGRVESHFRFLIVNKSSKLA